MKHIQAKGPDALNFIPNCSLVCRNLSHMHKYDHGKQLEILAGGHKGAVHVKQPFRTIKLF